MNNGGYRKTGIFLAIIFCVGSLVPFFQMLIVRHSTIWAALLDPFFLICLGMAVLFYFSSRNKKLAWFQPAIFLAGAAYSFFSTPDAGGSIYPLGFFMIGILLLFRFGFYETHRVLKLVLSLAYFYGLEIAVIFIREGGASRNLAAVFFMTVLLVMLYLSYQEKLMVYLHEPQETLSLKSKGLTDAEQKYVLAMVGGKSPKEIAFFYEVSESTVRNTLARAYKKLGVGDRSELAALAARVELVA